MNKPTKEMIAAGEQISSDLIDAHIAKEMTRYTDNAHKDWSDYENSDLVIKYLNNEITSVEAIYIAMERAK